MESFETRDDFRGKFTRQLALTLRDNPYLKRLLVREIVSHESAPLSRASSLSHMSDEARELIRKAATSQNDQIIIIRGLSGAIIQAGEKSFGQPNDRRSVARFEAAAKELSSRGLISDVNGKGEVFQVTDAGYRFIGRGN